MFEYWGKFFGLVLQIFAGLVSGRLVLLQAVRDELEAPCLSVYVVQIVLAVRELGFGEPDGLSVQGGIWILIENVLPPTPDQDVLEDLGYPVRIRPGSVPREVLRQVAAHLRQSVLVGVQKEFELLENVPGCQVLGCR